MKHLLFFTLLLSFSMYGAASAAALELEQKPIKVTTSDGQLVEVPKGYFSTLDDCVSDVSEDDLGDDGIFLKDITADDLDGTVAIAEKRPGTITEGVLAALYYFGYPRALPAVYCAWLQQEENKKVPVHSGTEKQLLQHMEFDASKCAGDMHETVWALNAEELVEVKEDERKMCMSKQVHPRRTKEVVLGRAGIDSLCCLQFVINPKIITELDLRGNQLTEIECGSFDKLRQLQKLNLGYNELTEIECGSFDKLRQLRKLYLNGNQLTGIKSDTFDQLSALQKLNLENNQLTVIVLGTFDKLQALEKLYLGDNRLTEIKPGTFDKLSALQELHLNANQLTGIASRTLDQLQALPLQKLDLYRNELKLKNIKKIRKALPNTKVYSEVF